MTSTLNQASPPAQVEAWVEAGWGKLRQVGWVEAGWGRLRPSLLDWTLLDDLNTGLRPVEGWILVRSWPSQWAHHCMSIYDPTSRPTSESSLKELNLSLYWTRPGPDLDQTWTRPGPDLDQTWPELDSKSPSKSCLKSPLKSPSKSTSKSTSKSPYKYPSKSPLNTLLKTPGNTPQSPLQSPP